LDAFSDSDAATIVVASLEETATYNSQNLDDSIHLARNSGHRLPDLPDFTEDDEFSDFGKEDE
jgi:hypothetical protein